MRVTIILALTLTGLYAQSHEIQRRMGTWLLGAGLFSCLWLLNGSNNDIAFTVGILSSALAPGLFFCLILACPTGRVDPTQLRLIVASTALSAACALLLLLTSARFPIATPLVHCSPGCPHSAIFVGIDIGAHGVLTGVVYANLIGLTAATFAWTVGRYRSASGAARASLAPVAVLAGAEMAFVSAFAVARATGSPGALFGAGFAGLAVAFPAAIFAGMYRERMFMGEALAQLVERLPRSPDVDVEALMRETLRDPTLKIAFLGSDAENPPDVERVLQEIDGSERTAIVVQHEGHPLAVISFDGQLDHQKRFVEAAAEAAILALENQRLTVDLRASLAEVAASRRRLVHAADAARRQIQDDLHDGAQQHLVNLRARLDRAVETVRSDQPQTQVILGELGADVDRTLRELRALASGVYPSALGHAGLVEALRSATIQMPIAVSIRGRDVGRHPPEIEAAVYFSCMEALQNVSKHAGPAATATVELEQNGSLRFEIRDSGVGFTVDGRKGNGIQNMRDRIEAVGGRLRIASMKGGGTVVRGEVPIQRGVGAPNHISGPMGRHARHHTDHCGEPGRPCSPAPSRTIRLGSAGFDSASMTRRSEVRELERGD